jgi:glycosyltransferase involved in cell wall biosynthesis
MPAVLRAQPRARLLLVKYRASAHLDYESHVERLIDELGVRGAVRCVPTIANDDMPAYYSASDCTVSVPNTDGTPMTVMESLACGTPVIISDLSDYDSDLFVDGRTVLRVPVADPDGLARGLLRLMGDTELREAIVRNGGRMVAERGAYTVEMQRLEAMYHSVITGHS